MKRKWIVVAFAAACAIALAGCSGIVKPPLIAVENVTLNKSEHWLARGAEFQLVATVTPDNAYDTTVTWSSSNDDVATVDKNGLVTARNEGYVYITAQAGEKTAVCEIYVYVYNPSVPVESISIYPNPLTLDVGDWEQLEATVLPPEANSGSVKWESDDDSIAEVFRFVNDVYVQAKKPGKTTIYASMGGRTATCAVTVNGVSLNKTYLPLMVGEGEQLTAKAMLNGVPVEDVRWESSYESVATVDEFGNVFAKGVGVAIISAYVDGLEPETCYVIVSGITLNRSNLSLNEEEEFELKATVTLNGVKVEANVSWSVGESSNESVVTIKPGINNDCIVKANAEGNAIIWASADGYPDAKCEVTVGPKAVIVESITLDKNTLSLEIGDDAQLTATVIPEGVPVKWSSSNEAIAKVDDNGIVKAIAKGNALIYVQAGDKLISCDVTVLPKITMENGVITNGVLTEYNGNDEEVSIPEGVTEIGENVFKDCGNLKKVTIPNTVDVIGNDAFNGCANLETVVYNGDLAQWCAMGNDQELMKVAKSVMLEDGTDLKQLEALTISGDVESISRFAFCKCDKLESVIIHSGVKGIHYKVFSECTNLKTVTIPQTVENLGVGLFENCNNLTTVNYGGTEAKWEALVAYFDIGLSESVIINYNYTEGEPSTEP